MIQVDLIRKLREKTGAPIMRVKKVLEEVGGDEKKAIKILKEEGFAKIAKRSGRKTNQGIIKVYLHHSGKIAAMVELLSETDFVAKNKLFQDLASDLAMQVASMNPKNEDELLNQTFIKDSTKSIKDLVKDVIAKTGENIRIGRFYRLEIGI